MADIEETKAVAEDTAKIVDDSNGGAIEDVVEDDEMNGLFGDEDDDDDDEENEKEEDERKTNHMGIDANSDNEEVPFKDDEEVEDEAEEEEEILTSTNITLQRHPRSHRPTSGLSFPLPRFLYVDPEPFAPNEFEEQIKTLASLGNTSTESLKNSLQFKKLELANTIRWRYAKSSSGSLHKQSNAQIIEWEDGSKSLKIGKEYFDIKLKANDDEILAFQNEDTLMGLLNLDQAVQVVPPSTKSQAHKLLAMTIKTGMKNKKAKKINTIVTKEDPEAKAREVERTQKEIEKARRRQMQKAQMEEEQMERKRDTTTYSYNKMDIDAVEDEEGDSDYGEGEDDEDGFVVGDDEDVESEADDDELDRAAERLKQVKRDGAMKYQGEDKRNASDNEDDEDDDEGAVIRKKRRVVLDDEDDE